MQYKLRTPVTREDLAPLRTGDTVLLSGAVYTARDAAHKRMMELLDTGGSLPFPVEADVRSYVNNEKRQDSNTRFFLTDLPQIIEDLSRGMTLEPGDIIATGTPAGVGMGFRPPRFMKAGDCVTCEIPPIGTLTNYII